MEKIPMTIDGFNKMKTELEHLQKVERPQISAEIGEAREQGDLKENAEYQYAKDKQGFIEGRIAELSDKISRAQVVDPAKLSGSRAMLGATVEVVNLDTDKEHTYILVGPDEADLDRNMISVSSPLGRALIGKEEGDEITFKAPGGEHEYEILKVSFKAIG